jgi:hypothetical protein
MPYLAQLYKKASIQKINRKGVLNEIMHSVGIFPFYKPRNAVLDIFFSPDQTKFDVNLLIIRSIKSLRTQRRLESREKKILQYRLAGKCLRYRKAGLFTTYTLRNALSLIAFECNYAFFSRFLVSFEIRDIWEEIENQEKFFSYKKSTLHYLRKKSAVFSIYLFDFVTDFDKEEEIQRTKDTVFNYSEDREDLYEIEEENEIPPPEEGEEIEDEDSEEESEEGEEKKEKKEEDVDRENT